ncbi:hypothetical protein [Mycobacterium sp.]|uniref:hypothetical protein n=1 Tax=Mycobacterium sp. TaxID=1785 RepID=UPI0025FB473A|nr:hypothetical protein [Mycobacterium sp.]
MVAPDVGLGAGHYVVEPTAKTQAWAATDPQGHLGGVADHGDPVLLRSYFVDYVAPLWTKPWPADTHANETGSWLWDEATQRWYSQRDRWRYSIAGFVAALGAHLPETAMDYSTASLESVEAFVVHDATAQGLDQRSAVVAYLGECLLRAGGGRWIWDIHPDHLTNGLPIVKRDWTSASPSHLIEYAKVLRDGQTFSRVHRAWLTSAGEQQEHNRTPALRREPTPGLDPIDTATPFADQWRSDAQMRFPDWVDRYGAGRV